MRWDIIILVILAIICVGMIVSRVLDNTARKQSRSGTPVQDRRAAEARADAKGIISGSVSAELWAKLTEKEKVLVDAELAKGRLINAIKLFRDFSRSGLKEAKEAVEVRKAEMGF